MGVSINKLVSNSNLCRTWRIKRIWLKSRLLEKATNSFQALSIVQKPRVSVLLKRQGFYSWVIRGMSIRKQLPRTAKDLKWELRALSLRFRLIKIVSPSYERIAWIQVATKLLINNNTRTIYQLKRKYPILRNQFQTSNNKSKTKILKLNFTHKLRNSSNAHSVTIFVGARTS